MPDVTAPRTPPDLVPRWPSLCGLGLAVLALHLWLLTDGLPSLIAPAEPAATAEAPAALSAQVARAAEGHPAAQPSVRISQIRWIVPTPLPAPEPVLREAPARPSMARKAPDQAKLTRRVEPLALPAVEPEVQPEVQPEMQVPVPEAVASTEMAPAQAQLAQAPAEEAASAGSAAAPADTAPPTPETPTPPPAAAAAAPAPAPEKTLPPAQPPASTRLQYEVTGQARGFHYNATGTLDWELTAERYSARMEMRMPLLGARVQTSTGAVGPEGLIPERFADKGRSERAAHFERDQRRIRFSANTPEAEWMPGAQDRLSLFLQIAGLLQANPQGYPAGAVIDMQVAGTGDAEIWRFQVGDESVVTLPAGELRVRHLVRQPRKEFDSTVEMWLAPELNHLPVRLKVTQANGDMADQQLSERP